MVFVVDVDYYDENDGLLMFMLMCFQVYVYFKRSKNIKVKLTFITSMKTRLGWCAGV